MFERFTDAARTVVTTAHDEARTEHAADIREEHLLAGLLASPTGAQLLSGWDVDAGVLAEIRDARRRGGLSDADAHALAELGIDLVGLVDRVEGELGRGALDEAPPTKRRRRLRFSAGSRDVLARGVRCAQARHDGELTDVHLLLGLVARRGLVADVLGAHGVTTASVLAALDS